jgi:hypothetical protein
MMENDLEHCFPILPTNEALCNKLKRRIRGNEPIDNPSKIFQCHPGVNSKRSLGELL